jgi:hypothetical protein
MGETALGLVPDVRNVLLMTGDTCVVLQMPGRWEWLYLQTRDGESTHELGCHYIDRARGYCYLWLHRYGSGRRLWLLVDQPLPRLEVERIIGRMRAGHEELVELTVRLDRLRLEEIGSRPLYVER